MDKKPLISLCIPTNGVIEWIFPVLESIYSQKIDNNLFEVVVCDNGNNPDFKSKIKEFASNHSNFIYKETSAPLFLSEPETYKLSNGHFIKFINHRTKLINGTLKYFIDFVQKYMNNEEKPIIYFTNNLLKQKNKVFEFSNFSDFVENLKIYSSWSTGMGIWKDDFDKLLSENPVFNELFPHTTVLFNERKRKKYIIDNNFLLDEMPQAKKPKGNYDLFYAFGVEYPSILLNLVISGDLDCNAFITLKKEILKFCSSLASDYFVFKLYCSYDLNNFNKSMSVFYNKVEVYYSIFYISIWKIIKKIFKRLFLGRK